MNKQPTLTLIESLISKSTDYVKNRADLMKLKAVDKTAEVVSSIVPVVALVVIFFIFFIVLNIGIALLIGDLVGKSYLGFLILAAIYGIVGFVLIKGKDKLLKAPVANMLIKKLIK